MTDNPESPKPAREQPAREPVPDAVANTEAPPLDVSGTPENTPGHIQVDQFSV